MSVAAAFSTGSAINATLFATARLAATVATDGELPTVACHRNPHNVPNRALLVLAAMGATLAAIGSLGSLVEAASLVFLFTFGIVITIAVQAARATGITVSALRYYEKEGVVVPERTDTGYRSYGHEDMEALRFLARAKTLGLTLPEISELLTLLAEKDCQPVQTRLRQLVTDRIRQAQDQIADLVGFTGQLQQAATRLGVHTAEGACNDRCGCTTAPTDQPPP